MEGPVPEPAATPGAISGREPGATSRVCPACGFVQERWARVCPKCGYLWPDAAEGEGSEQARLTSFQDQLAAKAPAPALTLVIIGLNFAIFAAMLLTGVSLMSPDIPSLLKWGANLGTLTASGQWWRLLTCTFLHIGLIHILFNMYVLWDIGRFLESLVGRMGFAVVYLLAGLAGSIASLWWNPHIVSAGASGAIFGLYGCLLGYLLARSPEIPAEVAKGLGKNALLFLGYNLVWGLTQKGIDMAGHLGGLLGGLACGYALARSLRASAPEARPRINLQVLAAGLALLTLAAVARPRPADYSQEVARFQQTEISVLERFKQAIQQLKAGRLSDQELARLIDAEIVPPWRAARLRLAGVKGLPEPEGRTLARVARYAETRERGWMAMSEGLRKQDLQALHQAKALHADAERQLQEMGSQRP